MCSYCPQDALKSAYKHPTKYLSLDNFKLILSKVPPYVRIDFSGMAEPWANPACTSMLRHALERGYHIAIYTTLYSMAVDEADEVIGLLREHLDQLEVLCLHLPDRFGNMRGWRYSEDYGQVLKKMIAFGHGQPCFQMMTMDYHGGVAKEIREIVEWLPDHKWQANNRAGSLDASAVKEPSFEDHPRHEGPVSCSFTQFYDQNVVLPDGSVLLCCMDYSREHVIGNLLTGDYWSLFSSPGMTKLEVENRKCGHSGTSICKSCSRAVSYDLDVQHKQFWTAHPPS